MNHISFQHVGAHYCITTSKCLMTKDSDNFTIAVTVLSKYNVIYRVSVTIRLSHHLSPYNSSLNSTSSNMKYVSYVSYVTLQGWPAHNEHNL